MDKHHSPDNKIHVGKGKGSSYNSPWGPKRGSRGIALPFCEPRHEKGMGWLAPHPGRFTPRKETRYPLYRRLGGPQGWSGRLRKILPPLGFDPRTIQPVVSRYTDYAIPVHIIYMHNIYFFIMLAVDHKAPYCLHIFSVWGILLGKCHSVSLFTVLPSPQWPSYVTFRRVFYQ
jgi:hypothetical protein